MKYSGKTKGREYWHQHVEKYMQSGLSQREYCRHNNLSYWSFNPWYRRLKNKTESLQKISPKIVKKVQTDSNRIEIIIDEKLRLSIPENFSEGTLKRLLQLLGAAK